MSKKADPTASTPILVVFGIDDKEQCRAAAFHETDFEAARKAAGLMKLDAFESTAQQLRPVLKNIPDGQIAVSGYGFVGRVARQHYDALLTAIASLRPTASLSARKAAFPASWAEIQKGCMVICQADAAEFGWWECVVEKVEGDILTLSWLRHPKDPKVKRHRDAVALVKPPHLERPEA